MQLDTHVRACALIFCGTCVWSVDATTGRGQLRQRAEPAPSLEPLDPPRLSDLAGTWLTYRRGLGHPSDPVEWDAPKHGIALPTANSELGSMIADENVLAVRDITMPPFTQGPYSSVARNASTLGRLLLDGVPLYTESHRWTPFGFQRRAGFGRATKGGAVGQVLTEARIPLAERGVLLSLDVSVDASTAEASASVGSARLAIELWPQIREYPAAEINCSEMQWRYPSNMQRNCWNWYAPRSFANESDAFVTTFDATKNLLVVRDSVSGAVSAVVPSAGGVLTSSTTMEWSLSAATTHVTVAVAFGARADEPAVIERALRWAESFENAFAAAENDRQDRFNAVFDAKSNRYSGSLPLLTTDDKEFRSVYYSGVVSMLELERNASAFPFAPKNTSRVFVTGAGSNTSTNAFFWDMAYCATALVMLDPQTIRNSLLEWLEPALGGKDALAGWGVDFFSGRAVGNHYAANDFTLFKLCLYYTQITADFAFLEEKVAGRVVLEWMQDFATAYKNYTSTPRADAASPYLDTDNLADYGFAANLLECVPTYQHKVASFNAANVWMLEQLAALLVARGKPGDAAAAKGFAADARAIATAVLSLYVPGEGVFKCRYPNGTEIPVRHVIDFVYVSEFMSQHLSPLVQSEMNTFVSRELLTDTWMRALSREDGAAAASDRTDHGPNGAYDGWPPLTVAAFARSGNLTAALDFLKATSFVNQLGPYGQAHGVSDPKLRSNATYKPFEFTLSNAHGGTDFVDASITAVFGLQPAHATSLTKSRPPIAHPTVPRNINAVMDGVRWQGTLYRATIGKAGAVWVPSE